MEVQQLIYRKKSTNFNFDAIDLYTFFYNLYNILYMFYNEEMFIF